jgi:Zn-dependent protease with chaperone function
MLYVPSSAWRCWAACVFCVLTASTTWGQSTPTAGRLTRDNREITGALTLDLDTRGQARIYFSIGPLHPEDAPVDWRRLPDERAMARAVEQAIGGTLLRVRSDVNETDGWTLTAKSDNAFRRRFLHVQGRVDGAPILAALADAGLTTLSIDVTHPNIGQVDSAPQERRQDTKSGRVEIELPLIELSLKKKVGVTPEAIAVDYGYGPAALAWVVGPMLTVLALPLAAVWWLRQRALAASDADPTAVWFSYARWSGYVVLALWLVWLACLLVFRWTEFCDFAVDSGSRQLDTLFGFVLMFGLPGAVVVYAARLSWPVYARVRGVDITAGDLTQQALWTTLAQIAPVSLVVTAVTALLEKDYSAVALWLACAYFGRRMLVQQVLRSRQMTPQAITSGELRDRIFALAERAGVKLGQIYLLPAGKFRAANAFAMTGNNVLLTDYLLEHLSKREIDAVMAHELGHLRHRHPVRLSRAGLLSIVLPGVAYIGLYRVSPVFVHSGAILFPLMIVLGMLLTYRLSRRYERVADSEAVQLTADAPAMIAALGKISRLNRVPLEWGRGEAMLTHPSTLRRAEALAQQGHVPTERLPDLLAGTLSDTERYQALPTGIGGEGPLFSTMLKARWLQSNAWISVWITILTPALFALADRAVPVPAPISWIYWPAGLVATLALLLLTEDRFAARRFPELGRKLAARLAYEGIPPPGTEGYFVQFAPAAQPASYEGFTNWDVGLLILTGDRLCYVGEQTRFALRRTHIIDVRIGPGAPGLQPSPTLYVTWRDPVLSIDYTFNLRSGDAPTRRGISRATVALTERVKAWRQEPDRPGLLPPALAELSTPERQSVTSIPLRDLVRLPLLLRLIWLKTLLACGVCLVTGLSLQLFPPGTGWYVVAVSSLTVIVQALAAVKGN